MARVKQAIVDQGFLSAALEGLELQQRRIEEQIAYVKSLLDRKRPAGKAPVKGAVRRRRRRGALSEEARERIAKAQKKRWAAYRKSQGSAA